MDITRSNPYFNNFGATNEQELYEDLIIEAHLQNSMDMYYLPRRLDNYDALYGASDLVTFPKAYTIPTFLESIDGFTGEGTLMSKFGGLEIRDSIVLSIPRRIFTTIITNQQTEVNRPREGDLIYWPLNGKCFQIMYTNNKQFFYPLGILPSFELTLELFEYSNETFKTGIPEIDKLQEKFSTNILDYAIKDVDGTYIKDESNNYITNERFEPTKINPFDNSEQIQEEYTDIADWSGGDSPFGRE